MRENLPSCANRLLWTSGLLAERLEAESRTKLDSASAVLSSLFSEQEASLEEKGKVKRGNLRST